MCAERLLSSIIDMNDLNHDAQQVSVYLELDALPCGAACVAVGLKYPHIRSLGVGPPLHVAPVEQGLRRHGHGLPL